VLRTLRNKFVVNPMHTITAARGAGCERDGCAERHGTSQHYHCRECDWSGKQAERAIRHYKSKHAKPAEEGS
jgi:hypothetical protein